MAALTQMELSSIREVASSHQTVSSKLCAYAQQCADPQVKQMFQQASTEAQNSAQKLIAML